MAFGVSRTHCSSFTNTRTGQGKRPKAWSDLCKKGLDETAAMAAGEIASNIGRSIADTDSAPHELCTAGLVVPVLSTDAAGHTTRDGKKKDNGDEHGFEAAENGGLKERATEDHIGLCEYNIR